MHSYFSLADTYMNTYKQTCIQAYDRTLFLFGANYKFRSHLRHSVTTLILNCKVSRLARLSHMTLSDTTNYYYSRPHRFPRKHKSAETFWRSLVHIYIRTYTHTNIHTYVHTYIHIYEHTYVHAYIHIYTHTYTHIYIHTCMHTYIYIYIHTYIHI